jgi:NAD(P)H-hydrate epimerase
MTTVEKSALPASLYRAEQVRAMDRYAIEHLGIAGTELMRRAGEAAFAALRRRWPMARTVSVLCGGGNNGGDGYVLARAALQAGLDVSVHPLAPVEKLGGDALLAYQAYRDAGGSLAAFIPSGFEGCEVLVDAMLGIGLDRAVEGPYAEVIAAVHRFHGGVLALDIPSGLDADTGHPWGGAIRADLTITFIALKQGLFTGAGLAHCGGIVLDDLATPPAVQASQKPSARLLPGWTGGLPARARDTHKGRCGHVLVVGGAPGFSGAARLAAEAAARVGAGLISLATPSPLFMPDRPELMCHGVARVSELLPLLHRANVVALGPGLGQSDWSRVIHEEVLRHDLPLVMDADALNLLAASPQKRENWILTPHPGEAARLLRTDTATVQRDRYAAIAELRARFGGTVVLKGSGTLIQGENGLPQVCTLGNPGMASGGMGDVLTGVIAGLWAQGLPRAEAAETGVRLHGAAGDAAAREGERGLLASELMPHLRRLVNA